MFEERIGKAAFRRLTEKADLLLQRSVLRGPEDHEVEQLRRYGWDPHAGSHVAENRAMHERSYSMFLDDNDECPMWLQDAEQGPDFVVELFEV
jgi:hypothetical protein